MSIEEKKYADKGSLSVVIGQSEFEDPDLSSEPDIRVHGTTNGLGWSLPIYNAMFILNEDQQWLIIKMLKNILQLNSIDIYTKGLFEMNAARLKMKLKDKT